MGNEQADRTLFVGNLHTRVTEELLFELFLQAGPTVNVKIPKDKDGKSKMFAFINFKHEESVPYGMNLLNGVKLYGRPLKLQYRSGSTHVSQDTNPAAQSPQGNGQSSNGSSYPRQDINEDFMKHSDHSPIANYQRSFSSSDNLQRQAVMNSFKQEYLMGQQPCPPSSSYTANNSWSGSSNNLPPAHRYESPPGHRSSRTHGSHPYKNESYNKADHEEHHYRSHGHEEHRYRSHGHEEQHYRSHGQEAHHYRSHGSGRSSPNLGRDPRWGSPYH